MNHFDLEYAGIARGGGNRTAPVIYVIDSTNHPAPIGSTHLQTAHVVTLPVQNWNDALTPWVAPGLYRGEPDFGGQAQATLRELVNEAIPAVDATHGLAPGARAICGYSLAGLFSLYALVACTTFHACGCLSGSVWYPGWVDYLRNATVDLSRRFAYLSIGTKEKRAARPILHAVQRNMEDCASALERHGCAVCYRTSPGNHMQHIPERFAAGLNALDEFLA